ncbi:hypothetical protein N177_3210 [Lutibaculum baratangense AMV1]|uniref:Uncharacterized protein n=2 Tax=Lutibaculum TaxID=1358438 RepID=V4QTP8_9HYPH|nr:hypothetical protein N177_3210 [Lutibaculum baratangense AMV1]
MRGNAETRGQGDVRTLLLAEIDRPRAALMNDPSLLDSREAWLAVREEARRRKEGKEPPEGAPKNVARAIYFDEVEARVRRIRRVDTGFVERIVGFWTNHFAVDLRGGARRGMAGAYEREAIRPHVLGHFDDLLLAATRHPAMLYYLNNITSVGPNSRLGVRRGRGLNENHAREILELHTVGVTGGYTQDDVIALAKILTGWSLGADAKYPERFGRFTFKAPTHEPGPQVLMGTRYPDDGEEQGVAALRDLARQPATARHVATKLARHFVSDAPPPRLVEALTDSFLDSDGDLRSVYATLLHSDEAWDLPPSKLRPPQEFLWATIRAVDFNAPAPFCQRVLNLLGQPLWNPPSPAGFPDDSAEWLAPDALTTRLDIAQAIAGRSRALDPRGVAEEVLGASMSMATSQSISRAETTEQGLALLLMSPEFQRR